MIEILIGLIPFLLILGFLLTNFVSIYLVPSIVFYFLLNNVALLKNRFPASYAIPTIDSTILNLILGARLLSIHNIQLINPLNAP